MQYDIQGGGVGEEVWVREDGQGCVKGGEGEGQRGGLGGEEGDVGIGGVV